MRVLSIAKPVHVWQDDDQQAFDDCLYVACLQALLVHA